MAERRPDPPDPRASLVDSGWSEPAIAPERELPAYEDAARESLVTRVDDQIQARIAAMNSDDRTVAQSPPGSPAPQRPSRPSRPPLPPPPALPPLPPAPARPPPPSARRHSRPPAPMVPTPSPLPELTAAPTDERTLVD